MLDDLRWLGLDWDEGPDVGGPSGPYVQSERRPSTTRCLERLKAAGAGLSLHLHAGRHRPRGLRPAPGGRGPDLSRHLLASLAPPTPTPSATARSPGGSACPPGPSPGTTSSWADVESTRAGWAATSSSRRHTVGPSYQLAVVADDAAMGVNQVIRGDDLVPSTPRQILLYRALGWPEPAFGHVPLAVDARRPPPGQARRLDQAGTLREAGVDPRRLIGPSSVPAAGAARIRIRRAIEAIGLFDPARLSRERWVVSPEWMNHIKIL